MKSWHQIREILGHLKWIIVTTLLIAGLLFFPDQVRELYRVTGDEGGSFITLEFVSIIVISLLLWLGTALLCAAAETQDGSQYSKLAVVTLRYLPAVLGVIPVFAAGFAQFLSAPDFRSVGPLKVGSVVRIEEKALISVSDQLTLHGLILFFFIAIGCLLALNFFVAGYFLDFAAPIQKKRLTAAPLYFSRVPFLALTAVAIVVITAIFILNPVAIPQKIGPFAVIAIFSICLTAPPAFIYPCSPQSVASQ
jgi:hypothetical protein